MLDDSFMAGNMTSAAASRIKAQRDRDAQRIQQEKSRLQPSGSVLVERIATYKAEIALEVMNEIKRETTDAEANKIIYANNKLYQFLNGFEQEVKMILKERPIKTEVSDEA